MYLLRNKVWLACVFLFVAHQISQKVFSFPLGFIDNYLDAFLCMPILLGLILQERRLLINQFSGNNKEINYRFSMVEMIVATTFFAIIFEEIFPKWSPYFTKDYWDYLAYYSGAYIFYIFINVKQS